MYRPRPQSFEQFRPCASHARILCQVRAKTLQRFYEVINSSGIAVCVPLSDIDELLLGKIGNRDMIVTQSV